MSCSFKMSSDAFVIAACSLAAVLYCSSNARAEKVVVNFVVEASTVTGTPFGFNPNDIRGRNFNGSFTYDTSTAGVQPGILNDSLDYKHAAGTSDFVVNIDGVVVSSSTEMVYRIVDRPTGSDQFQFVDGNSTLIVSPFGPTVMSVNGAADDEVGVSLTIVDASNPFSDKSLPNPFPYSAPVPPHTFALDDDNADGGTGGILFQFVSIQQVPEPTSLALGAFSLCALVAVASRRRRR